jgi:hypothetical protein
MGKNKKILTIFAIIVGLIFTFAVIFLLIVFTGRVGMIPVEHNCTDMGGYCSIKDCINEEIKVKYKCNLDGDSTPNEGQQIDGVCCLSI